MTLLTAPVVALAAIGWSWLDGNVSSIDNHAFAETSAPHSLELKDNNFPRVSKPNPKISPKSPLQQKLDVANQIKYEASQSSESLIHHHEKLGSFYHRSRTTNPQVDAIEIKLVTPSDPIVLGKQSRPYKFNTYLGYRDLARGINIEAGISKSAFEGEYIPFMRLSSRRSELPKYYSTGNIRHATHDVGHGRIDRWSNLDALDGSKLKSINPGQSIIMRLVRSGPDSISFMIRPANSKNPQDQGRITIEFPRGTLTSQNDFRRVVSFDGMPLYRLNSKETEGALNFSSVNVQSTSIRKSRGDFKAITPSDIRQELNHDGSKRVVYVTQIQKSGGQKVLFEFKTPESK